MRARSGFTLLESIVALAILSVGLMAAFAWFERDIDALLRVDRVALENLAVERAIDYLGAADLEAATEGELSWDDFVVRWRAAPLEERFGRTRVGLLGYHDVYLLEATLEVFHRGRLIARHPTIVMKSRLTRPPPEEVIF